MINIPLALLADYSNISREGKLNILGIFTQIQAQQEPVTQPQMQLVFNLEADRADADKKHRMEIELIDGDGKKIFSFGGEIQFGPPPAGETRVSVYQNLVMNSLKFPHFGRYDFKVLINGEVRKSVELNVVRAQTAPPVQAPGA